MLTVGGKTAEDHFLERFFAEWPCCFNYFDSRTIEVHLNAYRVNRNRARARACDRSKSTSLFSPPPFVNPRCIRGIGKWRTFKSVNPSLQIQSGVSRGFSSVFRKIVKKNRARDREVIRRNPASGKYNDTAGRYFEIPWSPYGSWRRR